LILARKSEELFDLSKVDKLCGQVVLSTTQINSAKEWIKLLDDNKLKKEKENQHLFEFHILQNILGYNPGECQREKEFIDYTINPLDQKSSICIEVKGSAQHLDAYQDRGGKKDKEKPISQLWGYMGEGYDYGICSNYDAFWLITKDIGTKKIHKFNFLSIKSSDEKLDEDKLKEFIGIFSRNAIFNNHITNLIEESERADEEFTEEFYKLFHETRLMIIKEFNQSSEISYNEAVHWAQIFLNRLIFIYFVEDQGFFPEKLFRPRIKSIISSPSLDEETQKVFTDIIDLFGIMNKGSQIKGVHGFNGGLFGKQFPPEISFRDLRNKEFFNDEYQNFSTSLKSTSMDVLILSTLYSDSLSPLIRNLLLMDSYDFTSDLDVDILGHIFEQSISDLESLHQNKSSKRKTHGVYYTPDPITEHICTNAIVSYLSKQDDQNSITKLVDEYSNNLDELESKIKDLTILDPACGSGAFLVKSVDILLKIDLEIQKRKSSNESIVQTGMDEFNKIREINLIIENNIHGVDINEESVEITKLSLFLKLAGPRSTLGYLSNNIKVGNSLIDDKNTSIQNSFSWEDEFPHIMGPLIDDKGFDVIVGNPPWQILKPDVDEFFSNLYNDQKSTTKFSKLTKNKKNQFVTKCLENKQIKDDWNDYERNYKKQMDYFNKSDKYPHQISKINGKINSSDINLYKLFIEASYNLLKNKGYCGLCVPSGIYSDLGTKGLRKLLLSKNRLINLFSFVNKKAIFGDVHRQFKFCTFSFQKGVSTKNILANFYIENILELTNFKEYAYDYDVKLIEMSSPEAFSFIECKNNFEFQILEKLYKFPVLSDPSWNFQAMREFDMTNDSKLFHTTDVGNPLYEGKMIHMFTNEYAKPRYWIEVDQGTELLKSKETNRIKKMNKNSTLSPNIDSNEYRLVWRSITNSTNQRTLISTILPPNVFLGNSLNYLKPKKFDGEKYVSPIPISEIFFICGIFNSFPIDFILRHKVATNLNIFYMMELPIPRYDEKNKLHKKLFENTVKLICTSEKYFDILDILKISYTDLESSKKLGLEAQINALSAKIYNLTKEDLEFVLNNFPIVDAKLKDATLDEYDLL
jgi:Alw26I/Eco31I/Esp3I family type II restriction m6 adenine DNA methyltransferase